MAKKDKKIKETTIENYYDLKVDKVDELVAALKDDDHVFDSEVNYSIAANTGVDDPNNYTRTGKEKQFNPYKRDFLSRIPVWLKALFIKWWFAGMVSWFVLSGILNLYGEDGILAVGLIMGAVVDMFVNPIFHYMESDSKEYNNYMMFPFPFKAIWTLFANLIYYLFIIYLVNLCYFGLNGLINYINATPDKYNVVVEPLLFGAFAVIVDMVFIGIKDGVVALIRHLINRKKETVPNV